MKIKFTQLIMLVILLAGCREKLQLEESTEGLFPAELSDKPIILKLSFIEETQRKAEFPEGVAENQGLTYLEEPKSERKQIYMEVYYDFAIGKQVEYLAPNSDFPADKWQLPSDMPKLKKVTYLNGVVKGYDRDQNLIYEDIYEQDYWLDPTEFESAEEAREFAIAAYYNPKTVADKMIDIAIEGANSYTKLSDQVLQFMQVLGNISPALRGAENTNLEVSTEKIYMLAEYGVVFRTEGYSANGDLKDMEHNFYTFNEDSVLYIKSSHYRNLQYSSAYDVSFTEFSDTFYEDFQIETSVDY